MLNKLSAFFLDILEVVVFAIAIFLFLYLLVLQPHKIKGQSMEPNFQDGEFLLTDKVTYRFSEPKRGDVIVFEAPGTNNEEFIKRIMGLPGESISINNGKLSPRITCNRRGNVFKRRTNRCYSRRTLFCHG
jgi:signal peptidase I